MKKIALFVFITLYMSGCSLIPPDTIPPIPDATIAPPPSPAPTSSLDIAPKPEKKNSQPAEKKSPEQACQDGGGEWALLSNGCVDACDAQRNEMTMCTMAFEEGCDCGPDQCWNGTSCENN